MKHYLYSMKVRRATVKDIPVIHDLAERIWKVHYPAIISMEQINYMLDKMYSRIALEEQIKSGHHFYLLISADVPVGYLSYSSVGENEYFLHKLYIDSTLHHKGMGSYFFNQIFGKLKGIKSIRLTVNRQNFSAINFYFKTGFVIQEVKDFDIGNGYQMNDFVMVKKF